jgi:hypothetical protein
MRSRKEIEAKLDEIEADERLSYSAADVRVNAPLALEQVAGKAEANMLRWVLSLPPGEYHQADWDDY